MIRTQDPIVLPPIYLIDYDDVLGVDCDQTAADVAMFLIPFNCEILESQCWITEVCAGSTSTPVVAFDKRILQSSDTGRVAATAGSFAFGTAAAGSVLVDRGVRGTKLLAGQQIIVELVTAAVGTPTGHFRPQLIVAYSPETLANMSLLTNIDA